ncbi:hypothetical protein LIER_04972 [Lithospermum erythrorhizon]|uniref:Uncharacterized protein n=1 Tax=Lithospermum erythrorhizon TaxID=34254 RepID=A0AAV3NZZ9_LITER
MGNNPITPYQILERETPFRGLTLTTDEKQQPSSEEGKGHPFCVNPGRRDTLGNPQDLGNGQEVSLFKGAGK